MKINILGTKIDNLNRQEAKERINEYLKGQESHYIVTPNPEFVLMAQKNKDFQNILNKADIAVPDGAGIVFASWWLKHLNLKQKIKFSERVCGSDLVEAMLRNYKDKYRILVISRDNALSQPSDIKKIYPEIEVFIDNPNILSRVLKFDPQIIFITFGAPAQEQWIHDNLALLPNVKVMAGVGGSFDFLTHKIKRAPKVFRKFGLEWIWRLIQEPRKRFKRIYRAFLVFHQQVFWYGLFTKISARGGYAPGVKIRKYVNKKYQN